MSILTKFLKLVKPEKNDYVDVEKYISENYDKIDNKMEELSTSNDEKLNKGLVSEEYDSAKKIEDKIKTVQGIADNKLNKGSLPTTITDAKGIYDLLENNGGINIDTALLYLNDTGTKTQGKVYFDRNKKGLFECIKTTTNTVNSTEFFVDISNKASSDRLSNLVEIYQNGYDGYIKFSNGYCKQWGTTTDIYQTKAITLPIPYKDMLYNVHVSHRSGSNPSADIVSMSISIVSKNQIRINKERESSAFTSWTVEGYWK